MNEKYNGLNVPILVFQKESGCRLVPVANLQPGYGPWESLDAAREGLTEIFESIENVPSEYTFCVLDNPENRPREWWFTEKGVWETVAPKCIGDNLEALLVFRYNELTQELEVSYDGGITWSVLAPLSTPEGNFVNEVHLSPDGELSVSYDDGNTWFEKGKIKFEITSTGYFKYSFDNGNTWHSIQIIANDALNCQDCVGGGGGANGGALEVITSENIEDIEFQNTNDSTSNTYTGQEASDVLIYMATDYPSQMNTYMETNYPNVSVGSYVIVRSTMYDRTGGMSNASDATHTYELDPTWITAQVISNSTQNDWYHYYKITKIDIDKWAGVAWIGRIAKFVDTVRHTVTIGTVTPSEASVTVTYNGVTYNNLRPGSTITVEDDATITVSATAEGFTSYSETIEHIVADRTINIVLAEESQTVKVQFYSSGFGGLFGVTTDNYATVSYYWDGIYEFPKGTTIQTYFYTENQSDVCFNIRVWNLSEGTSTVADHPSAVYLKKGRAYYNWNSYTLNEDTFINGAYIIDRATGGNIGPSIDSNKITFVFDRFKCSGDAAGSVIGSMDKTGHVEIDYTVEYTVVVTIPGRPRQEETRTLTYHEETTNNYFKLSAPELPDEGYNPKFYMTFKVVGANTSYREVRVNFEGFNAGTCDIIKFVPTGYYELTFGSWDPSNLTLVMNGVTYNSNNKEAGSYDYRYFAPSTVFNCTASREYYQTKTWTDTMPEADYEMPAITLVHV